jgi:signal transduction histidine kinase
MQIVAARRPLATGLIGQGLSWFVAASIVVAASGLVAYWMHDTAHNVDRDTLNRGADAITANIEDQVRILSLAGTGTRSLVGQSIDDIDLAQLTSSIDTSVLTSLLAVVSYPVTSDGATEGRFIDLDFMPLDFDVPQIEITFAEVETLLESGDAFLSSPITTTDPQRLDYVVALPFETEDGVQLIGVVFRLDRMLRSAVVSAGGDQYAVEVIDPRNGNQTVAEVGTISNGLAAPRSPEGLDNQLQIVVYPGSGFPFTESMWIYWLVVASGLIVALLLMWMARMAKARADELAERLRLAQELNASKDRFLATVSHELRTPLTVVLGVASELGFNWTQFPDGDREDLLLMLAEQATEAANIVEDLLVAARSDPSQLRLALEVTGLSAHVDYALASLPAGSRSRISCLDLGDHVVADTTRLRQILRNLLENAVKYGGPNISVTSRLIGDRVEISVSDDGTALGHDDVGRIFEPYEQSHEVTVESPTGVGIGLYVSRLLARLMNGDLDCVREDGVTRFRLTVPAAAQPVVSAAAAS